MGAIDAGPSEHTPLEPGAVELTCVLRRDVFGAQGIGYQDLKDLVEEVPLSAALRFGMSRAGLPISP